MIQPLARLLKIEQSGLKFCLSSRSGLNQRLCMLHPTRGNLIEQFNCLAHGGYLQLLQEERRTTVKLAKRLRGAIQLKVAEHETTVHFFAERIFLQNETAKFAGPGIIAMFHATGHQLSEGAKP
jgi:Holliday junction resolvasome RuvABC endonuclease subunit